LFFLTLTYSSLFLFTKTNLETQPTKIKLQWNMIYKEYSHGVAACILLMAIYSFLPEATASQLASLRPVYWLEALAILAFGVAWFTKGEAILKDEI